MKSYDLIIIGVGPAGITAGIYAKNFGLDCLIIGEEPGGLINTAYKVENYPGIFNIDGKDLTEKFKAHQKYLKVSFTKERVKKINKQKKIFKICSNRNDYQAKSILLAFGAETKKLDIHNIEKFEGKGVGYHVCDSVAPIKNKTVAVIGGANAAAMTAVMLDKDAKKVYLIYRKDKLRADDLWINKIKKAKNIEIIYKANVTELNGKNKLEKIILDNAVEVKIDNLFIEAGIVPNTFLIKDLKVKTDKSGYIQVDKKQATNITGIFAAGDITTGSNNFRQIITACAEGAIAALGVFNYLSQK